MCRASPAFTGRYSSWDSSICQKKGGAMEYSRFERTEFLGIVTRYFCHLLCQIFKCPVKLLVLVLKVLGILSIKTATLLGLLAIPKLLPRQFLVSPFLLLSQRKWVGGRRARKMPKGRKKWRSGPGDGGRRRRPPLLLPLLKTGNKSLLLLFLDLLEIRGKWKCPLPLREINSASNIVQRSSSISRGKGILIMQISWGLRRRRKNGDVFDLRS